MQTTMPDIANTAAALQTGKLDWVGMADIELPFIFESLDLAQLLLMQKLALLLIYTKKMPKASTCRVCFST